MEEGWIGKVGRHGFQDECAVQGGHGKVNRRRVVVGYLFLTFGLAMFIFLNVLDVGRELRGRLSRVVPPASQSQEHKGEER